MTYSVTSPSEHLSWKEMACRDGTPYPAEWEKRALILGRAFEAIRAECGGKPIKVLSAYRPKTYNFRVGGMRASQHIEGRALDLRPPAGCPSTSSMSASRHWRRRGLTYRYAA